MYTIQRPKISIPKKTAEKIADVIGIGALLFMVGYLVLNWSSLPAQVPAHFGIAGEVDRWGSKYELLILPIIGIGIHILMHILEKKTHLHNYPARLNESNAKEFYVNSRQTLNYTKNICNLLFAYIVWRTVLIGLGKVQGLGMIPFGILLIALFGVVIWNLIRSSKIN